MKKKPSRSSFYERQYGPDERRDLHEAHSPGLQDEIEMLRVAMRRTLALSNGVQELGEMLEVLRDLSYAASKLAGLLRLQGKASSGQESDLAILLRRALSDTWAEIARESTEQEAG